MQRIRGCDGLRKGKGRTTDGNVSLALEAMGTPRSLRRERIAALLKRVGLLPYANKYPAQMSGGMQQRLQIARCLAQDPAALMMDEPFGALDAMTRQSLQDELLEIARATISATASSGSSHIPAASASRFARTRALFAAGENTCAAGFGLPNFRPRALAAAKAALVRSEINRASYSATAARIWIVKQFARGMSAAMKSIPLSTRPDIIAVLRASRSSRAMTSLAS